jgi:hypothetical protein
LRRSLIFWMVFQPMSYNASFEVGSNMSKNDCSRRGLFSSSKNLTIPVSFQIDSFMVSLIIYWTSYNSRDVTISLIFNWIVMKNDWNLIFKRNSSNK